MESERNKGIGGEVDSESSGGKIEKRKKTLGKATENNK